jgi:hypothetical protein
MIYWEVLGLIMLIELFGLRERLPIDYNFYINKMTNFIIDLGYNTLYVFSVCQIKYKKYYKKINNIVNPYITLIENFINKFKKSEKPKKIRVFKIIDNNGNIIQSHIIEGNLNEIDYTHLKSLTSNYKLLLLCEKSESESESGYTNNIFFTELPETFDYKELTYSFMMIELEYKKKKYVIDLKNKEFNYYIVNNFLNHTFFKYYLKNILNKKIDEDNFDYSVTIIDNNVNISIVLPNQCIIFNEDNYKILTTNCNDCIINTKD